MFTDKWKGIMERTVCTYVHTFRQEIYRNFGTQIQKHNQRKTERIKTLKITELGTDYFDHLLFHTFTKRERF